jgi:hypothetical protein
LRSVLRIPKPFSSEPFDEGIPLRDYIGVDLDVRATQGLLRALSCLGRGAFSAEIAKEADKKETFIFEECEEIPEADGSTWLLKWANGLPEGGGLYIKDRRIARSRLLELAATPAEEQEASEKEAAKLSEKVTESVSDELAPVRF